MMTQDTSSFFTTHQTRDVPRDRWGRYELPDPVSMQVTKDDGWTRATTFAATLAEQYGLSIWHQRQVVWGLSRRPDLITMASTIAGPEDKKALGDIVKEAHIAAGTQAKANRGSAIHRAIQAAERGAYHEVPEELRPHVSAYFAELKRYRLQVLPRFVERTVIVNDYHVAGTFDNLLLCPDGKVRVGDKKTGRMDYSDTEFAVQMALYANADAMFNYDTGQYEQLPEIEKDYAVLVCIDPDTGKTELKQVNIRWGWAWAQTCAQTMDIRKTKHAITPLIPPSDVDEPTDAQLTYQSMSLAERAEASVGTMNSKVDEFLSFWDDPASSAEDDVVTMNGQPAVLPAKPIPHVEHTRPSPTETAALASEGASAPDVHQLGETIVMPGHLSDPDQLMHRILGLGGKAKVQAVARALMGSLDVKESDPNGIKLSQYQHKIASAIITLAHARGVPIPGEDKQGQVFGIPAGPGPDPDEWKNSGGKTKSNDASGPTAAQKAPGVASADEVTRAEIIRTAVESIRMQATMDGLQERHAYYSQTTTGWTEEMQTAARTRAAEIDAAAGESALTPMQMIERATSRLTLAKAWTMATDGGKNPAGWTAELNEAAIARQASLVNGQSVAPSGNQ